MQIFPEWTLQKIVKIKTFWAKEGIERAGAVLGPTAADRTPGTTGTTVGMGRGTRGRAMAAMLIFRTKLVRNLNYL